MVFNILCFVKCWLSNNEEQDRVLLQFLTANQRQNGKPAITKGVVKFGKSGKIYESNLSWFDFNPRANSTFLNDLLKRY